MQLVQSRSRNLSSGVGTAGPVRVVLESADARGRWGTAGVSDNLLEACWQALVDATEYKLLKDDVQPRSRVARAGAPRRVSATGSAAPPRRRAR
jgi:2-isopropylmalate synthase